MTRRDAEEFAQFVLVLRGEAPHIPNAELGDIAKDLSRIARTIHRINERYCNGMEPEEEARILRRRDRLQQDATAHCAKLGVGLQVNGDPRGAALKLLLPSGRSNSWDGETWCVPE